MRGIHCVGLGFLLGLGTLSGCQGTTNGATQEQTDDEEQAPPDYQGLNGGPTRPDVLKHQDDEQSVIYEDPGAESPARIERALAVLEPTADSKATGVVEFRKRSGGGLEVTTKLEGLPEGKHGYHLHLYGDCSSEDGKSAGTHFNLAGSSEQPPADVGRITGNLGELEVGKDGRAEAKTTLKDATLDGRYGVVGRSVIVHAKGNDPAQPPIGAAGARLACGTVGIASASDDSSG